MAAVARPGEILVQWKAPRNNTDATDLLDLAGFYVYRAQETFADFCLKCPRSYELLFDYEYQGPRGQHNGKLRHLRHEGYFQVDQVDRI